MLNPAPHAEPFASTGLAILRAKLYTATRTIGLDGTPPFWTAHYRSVILGILLVAQSLLVLALLWERINRKKTQRQLIRANDRLKVAMESGLSVGWEWDIRHDHTTWFGDIGSILGTFPPVSTATLDQFLSYVPSEERQQVVDEWSHAKRDHRSFSAEFRVVRSDGAVRWIALRGRFEYDNAGTASHTVGILTDVTERKKVFEDLRKSEEKFSRAFRESPLAVTLTSATDYRYIDVNETFERLTGWSREEAVGRTTSELNLWVDATEQQEFEKQIATSGVVRNAEIKIRRRDGEIRNILKSSALIEIGANPCLVFVITDITDLRKAEEARRASEDRFRQFFASLPACCYMTSPLGRVVDANPAACSALGYTREELIGMPLTKIYASESHSKLASGFERWKKEGTVQNEEMVILTKQGLKRTVLVNAGSVRDPNGNLLHSATVQTDITERKQINNRLRESQGRLEGIVKSAMDGIIAIDDEQRVVVFNSSAERIFGCKSADVIGTAIDQFIPERFRAVHADHIRRFAAEHTSNRPMGNAGRLWALRANGEEFPVEATISQLEAGGEKFFTVVVRDISDRLKSEEIERKLTAIVRSADDAILSKNLSGTITSWNPGAERLYGYTEAEAVGRSIMTIIPTEFQEQELEILHRIRDTESTERVETVRVTKSGQRRDVSITASPIRNSTGEIVGYSTIHRDITERKRAEAELLESELRFRNVANTAPVMIWIAGTDKLRTYFNDPWLEFTGRSLEEDLGTGWATGIHPDDSHMCLKTYERAFDRRESFQMEYRLRRRDGEYRWIFDHGVPRFEPDGTFAGYIGSCIDISDQKLAQEVLSSLPSKLLEAQEQERAFIARELHENINQRIALISVNLDRLKQELPPTGENAKQRLDEICSTLSDLGTDVQILSHHLHSSKLDYLGIAATASSLCRELSEKHGIRIDFRSEEIPPDLNKEISLCLFRVLQEALQNAIRHSRSTHFEVSLARKLNTIELAVRDWGIGFDQRKILREQGLGLTSMRERLRLCHGNLVIESEPGCGTRIRATVPLVRAASA